ncbi:hypothetical protein [Micromonospora rubida]
MALLPPTQRRTGEPAAGPLGAIAPPVPWLRPAGPVTDALGALGGVRPRIGGALGGDPARPDPATRGDPSDAGGDPLFPLGDRATTF